MNTQLTTLQVASTLRISMQEVQRLVRKHLLRSCGKRGTVFLFDSVDVLTYIQRSAQA